MITLKPLFRPIKVKSVEEQPKQSDPTRSKSLRDKYARELKKPIRDAKAGVKEQITLHEPNPAIVEVSKEIINNRMSDATYKPVIAQYTLEFWKRGDVFAKQQLNKAGMQVSLALELPIQDQATLETLESIQLDLIKGLREDTKKRLAFELKDGLLRAETKQKLVDRVTKVFHVSLTRAETIARTESMRVFNQAAIRRYEMLGIRKYRWLAAFGNTCTRCALRHGKIYESAVEAPPLHPNCVCTLTPVVELR